MTQLPQQPQEASANQMLEDFLFILKIHKWKVVMIVLLITTLTAVITFNLRPVYESTADLYLRPGREEALDEIHKQAGDVGVAKAQTSEIIKTELEIMQSPDIFDKTIDELLGNDQQPEHLLLQMRGGPEADKGMLARIKKTLKSLMGSDKKGDPRVAILKMITNNLAISHTKDTRMINLAYKSNSPAFSRRLLDAYIKVYIEVHREMTQTTGQVQHFTKSLERHEADLLQRRIALQETMDKVNYFSLDGRLTGALQRLTEIQNQFYLNQRDENRSTARLASLKKSIATTEAMIITSESEGANGWTAIARMRERMFELELRLEDLISKYSTDSPKVKELTRQLAKARKICSAEQSRPTITKGINPLYQYLSQEQLKESAAQQAAISMQKTLKKQLSTTEKEIETLDAQKNKTDLTVKTLTMEIENLEDSIRQSLSKKRRAETLELQAAENITNVKISRAPRMEPKPVGPNKIRNLAIGLFLSLFAAGGLAFLLEFLSTTFRRSQEVGDKLALPILVRLPLVK